MNFVKGALVDLKCQYIVIVNLLDFRNDGLDCMHSTLRLIVSIYLFCILSRLR